jgi:hypothetical protein
MKRQKKLGSLHQHVRVGKTTFLRELLQVLLTPDDEGAYFRRKPNPNKDQEVTTDDDSEESADEGQPDGPNSPQHQ